MTPLTWLWISFVVIFFVVVTVDMLLTIRRQEIMPVRKALCWTSLWVSLAFLYALAIYLWHPHNPKETAMAFIAGYLTEYSLSVDNLFVFIMIFSLMTVPQTSQAKMIKLGILLSIVLRVLFILFGIALIEKFHFVIYFFGGLLIWTAVKMITSKEAEIHPDQNILYKWGSKFLPVDHQDQTPNLFSRVGGKLHVTRMFLVFLVIGSTDVLFAIDSIPAIMGISRDPFVVITSNIFAVLGLVSLYFAIKGVMKLFRFLKIGVSLILLFIGLKMVAGIYNPLEEWFKHNSWVSLVVIVTILVVSIVMSVIIAEQVEKKTEEEAIPQDRLPTGDPAKQP